MSLPIFSLPPKTYEMLPIQNLDGKFQKEWPVIVSVPVSIQPGPNPGNCAFAVLRQSNAPLTPQSKLVFRQKVYELLFMASVIQVAAEGSGQTLFPLEVAPEILC
jgi:hypothetical protein